MAAAMMVDRGYEVVGLSMKTHDAPAGANRACCTPDDLRDARRVADALGIRFYVLNYTELFEREVVGPFAEAYLRGHTPNPCVDCNAKVKFKPLLERAKLLGASRLVTGHYARIQRGPEGVRLGRGADPAKDQSYFLYRLLPEQLDALELPLGPLSKPEVRALAEGYGLPTATKAESQEICFVGGDGYAATVERIAGRSAPAGDIVDGQGRVLGRHAGVHHFTLGQRRGLGISAPEPMYVTDIDAGAARVIVGAREDLQVETVTVNDPLWLEAPPDPGETVWLQQRYREKPRRARVAITDGRAVVQLEEPGPRGAPGQAAVIYREAEGIQWVVGGGPIAPTTRPRLPILPRSAGEGLSMSAPEEVRS